MDNAILTNDVSRIKNVLELLEKQKIFNRNI